MVQVQVDQLQQCSHCAWDLKCQGPFSKKKKKTLNLPSGLINSELSNFEVTVSEQVITFSSHKSEFN